MSSRVTLTDIAEELGLSISTVSNAYNRPDQLSAATRQQVLATAKRLGYAGPDPRASSLRSGRAGAIGLIELSLPTALTDPASLLMLSGVAQACDEAGVALVLIPSSEERESPKDIVRTAVVDGFVAHCDALDDERRADRRGAPPARRRARRSRPARRPVGRHRRGGRGERRGRPPGGAGSSAAGDRRLPCPRQHRLEPDHRPPAQRLPVRDQGRRHRSGHRAPGRGQRLRPCRDSSRGPAHPAPARPPDGGAGDERRDGGGRHRRGERRRAARA